jgi:hypothetical protein
MKKSIQILATLICFALSADALYADTHTWVRTTDGLWDTASNWSIPTGSGIPGAGDTCQFDGD